MAYRKKPRRNFGKTFRGKNLQGSHVGGMETKAWNIFSGKKSSKFGEILPKVLIKAST